MLDHAPHPVWTAAGIVAVGAVTVCLGSVLGQSPRSIVAAQQDSVTTVYIVRHAERVDNSEDSPLSGAGLARAQELARVLGDDDLDAIFVTEFTRTQQTGAPLATAKGIVAEQYPALDPQSVVDTILADHVGDRILVVGHAGTVDDVATGLGATGVSDLRGDQFDRLLVVHRVGDVTHLDRLRYGAETP